MRSDETRAACDECPHCSPFPPDRPPRAGRPAGRAAIVALSHEYFLVASPRAMTSWTDVRPLSPGTLGEKIAQ